MGLMRRVLNIHQTLLDRLEADPAGPRHCSFRETASRALATLPQYNGVAMTNEVCDRSRARRIERARKHGLQVCAFEVCGKLEHHVHDFQQCGGCKVVAYCCREHQRAHWKAGHKKVCAAFARGEFSTGAEPALIHDIAFSDA
jgi:hypothetical protein